jgi:uracil-DNA glycosylase family 4
MGLSIDCLFQGDPNSEIVVVAEAPGEREKQMGVPLVGGSGQKLWKVLEAYGLSRKQCYVTNVCKRQIALSTKTNNRHELSTSEGDHWINLFRWELSQLPNAKVIICLGNLALKGVTGNIGVSSWRGSVLKYRNAKGEIIPVVVSFNPAMVMREPKWEPIFKMDMSRVAKVIAGRYPMDADKEFKYLYNLSPDEAIQQITRLRDEKLPTSFDIETIGQETACIGFSNGNKLAVTINFRNNRDSIYTMEEEKRIRVAIAGLFTDDNIKFIAQNANFDATWLWYKDRIRVRPVWFDTMTAHHTLYPRLPHNLGFLTTQYTPYPYYKEERITWKEGGDINKFWEYNGKDCIITHEIHVPMLDELRTQKLESFYFNHVSRLQSHLTHMGVCGTKIDVSLKEKLKIDLGVETGEYERQFILAAKKATKDEDLVVNPNSPTQLSDLFFNKLKLVGRGFSTDEENRDRMYRHHATSDDAKAMISKLNNYRKQAKFLSTYAEMEIDPDDRVRCEYKQIGTQAAPGRLSSSKSSWGTGMNLQNQPQKAQQMFIADEGQVFVYNDLSQAEARVVAALWKVKALLQNFEKTKEGDFDIHRLNASTIFQVPYSEIPKYDRLEYGKTTSDPLEDGTPTRRFLGKRCVHGLNYRMMAPKLADACNIPLSQAVEAFNSYHAAFPEIQQGWKETIARVKADKMIFTPMGRRLIFLEPIYDDEQLDSVIAFVPQSTIGDFVSSLIYKCHEDKEWPRYHNGLLAARCMLNIHDALISQCEPSMVATVVGITRKHASQPLMINGTEVSIPSEFKVSVADELGKHRWSTLSKYKG